MKHTGDSSETVDGKSSRFITIGTRIGRALTALESTLLKTGQEAIDRVRELRIQTRKAKAHRQLDKQDGML